MDFELIEKRMANEPKYRIKQIRKLIFQDFIENWERATTLPLMLRKELEDNCSLEIKHKIIESSDKNTLKVLMELSDNLMIETVLMKHSEDRATVCVSSQVGCALGCSFCATGTMGFKRNLDVKEIIEQGLLFSRYLAKQGKKVTNIVFMGMGEPFLNYDNVLKAIKILNSQEYFNIGARKISISTSGVIPGIRKLTKEKIQVNLSVSLHAPNNALRNKLMPINKQYSLEKLLNAVNQYIKKTNRKVMFEYLMIKGVNDSLKCAEELAVLMKRPLNMVNLIVYNQTGKFEASDRKTIKKFKEYLENEGIFTTQRYEFGRKIKAACGQLVANDVFKI